MKAHQRCGRRTGQCVICAQCESRCWWQKGEMKGTPFSFLDAPRASGRDDDRADSPLSQGDWWQPTSAQKILPLCFQDRLRWDYFSGGAIEAPFSPFPCWWWRRCLLWPPVWWCTLHLHNVSVTREEKKSVMQARCDSSVSFLTLGVRPLSHQRPTCTLQRTSGCVGTVG